METQPRFLRLPDQSFFLLGPRGTGKTTWLRSELPEARFFDLLRADVYRELAARPERLSEAVVRNIGNFSRFLEAVTFSHAAVLNVAAVAREAQVQRKTVAGYLDVLEDLLLSFRVPVFTRRARRKAAAHPKFFFFDAGVFRSLRPRGPLDRPQEIDGGALEGLVAQHLRAWCAYSDADAELFYWRTRGGSEVDFVVYGEGGFWAIEVKNSRRVDRADLRGLRTFRADYPECEPLLLYRGEESLIIDGVRCRPVQDFLESLRPAA